ncbi:DNA repair ATPase [Thalassotalea ganghwensis]
MSDKESLSNPSEVDSGSYDIIQRRLTALGEALNTQIKQLNNERLTTFGSTDMTVAARIRVRTEHNCVARDIAAVGDTLLFGYNVFLGLKRNITVADVFSLHQLQQTESGLEIVDVPAEDSFLDDANFIRDFNELYTYYNKTYLAHVYRQGSKLFAIFRIGERIDDIRVFRWAIDVDHRVSYIDNRGERDIKPPENFDFEWLKVTREQQEQGKFPHYNLFDTLFVESTGGTITLKVENNTEDGEGIYSEPVEDEHQSLDDADIHYARVGELILLKIKPYREEQTRHLIYNSKTQQVLRQDAIAHACIQLPEDHGIIFPGGYYLQNGDHKRFEDNAEDLQLHRVIKSPNGEDFLYIFFEPNEGQYALFGYNLITRTLQNPIYGHGQSIYEDGQAVIFKAESEPSRVHAMQIWKTPFCSPEFASQQPLDNSFYGKIGNPELVRGISDLYNISRKIAVNEVTSQHYHDLIKETKLLFDKYHWLEEAKLDETRDIIKQITDTSELVLDEFEKVFSVKEKSKAALLACQTKFEQLIQETEVSKFSSSTEYVQYLTKLTSFKGELLTLKELKYVDEQTIDMMEDQLAQKTASLSQATADFLLTDYALEPYLNRVKALEQQVEESDSVLSLVPVHDDIALLISELELLNHTMLSIDIEDSRQRTRILEDISSIFGQINRVKATAELAAKKVGSEEASAEFGARFKLLSQSVTSGLSASTSPQLCDEQLSQILVQLEELESQFSDYDEFYQQILIKRDEIYDSFEQHKQQLIDTQQRRCLNLMTAAQRIIEGIIRRSQAFSETKELNSYFAGDPMVSKLRQVISQLRELDDQVRADDLEAQLKNAKEQATRALRDRSDIYSADGTLVKIGDHQFSVNKQKLELTLLPKQEQMLLHISGSEFFEELPKDLFLGTEALWEQELVSESAQVYRGEYLAASILFEAQKQETFDEKALLNAFESNELEAFVYQFAQPRYQEGYDKGVHDADATKILTALLTLKASIGSLAYPIEERKLAIFYYLEHLCEQDKEYLSSRCQNLALMEKVFGTTQLRKTLTNELAEKLLDYHQTHLWLAANVKLSASYLIDELASNQDKFVIKANTLSFVQQYELAIKRNKVGEQIKQALVGCETTLQKYNLHYHWLQAFSYSEDITVDTDELIEAAIYLTANDQELFYSSDANVEITVEGLLGQHRRIKERCIDINYQEFIARLSHYYFNVVELFQQFHQKKQQVIAKQRELLKLDDFKPKALSSFVRNKLINDVYFPIIGANLAKQIGAAGSQKRSDLMGLLLLISPPGYGKTTLIEYIASKLGMTFVKINCPSIGHDQVSLDPSQAINSTAKSEVEKINLAFEMGNNVMLYLDDIQHTNPEFLQKFISLCDGSRKIDGVWKGQSKTYDMRGKKFAVVMAGNPYTESGEAFKIPDMLANRADIYNLGDTLSGREMEFSLSFIENSLTSNRYLAPLATRDMDDLYKLVKMADGQPVNANELAHDYSQAEINEIVAVIQRIRKIQQTVLKANTQYIASAAQDDKYRTEPPFKLQGSYRNMNKMVEKVVPVMTDDELEQLIADHYRSEAQTLTIGAEENLLKLGELRGTLNDAEAARWIQIKKDYARHQNLNGNDNPIKTVANQVALLQQSLQEMTITLKDSQHSGLAKLSEAISGLNLAVNIETGQKDNQVNQAELSQDILQQLAQTLTPLIDVLASNKALDLEMFEALQRMNIPPFQDSDTKETHIQKISREISQSKRTDSDSIIAE